MSLVRFAGIGLCVASLAGHSAAAEDGRPAAKLSQMFPMAGDFLALPDSERSHIEISYKITAKSQQEFRMWVESEAGRQMIERGPDGTVELAEVEQFLPANPMVMTDLPDDGGGSVSMTVSPRLDLEEQVTVSDVCTAMEQANDAIGKKAGLMAMMAPKMKGVRFELPANSSASLMTEDGTSRPLASEETSVTFKPKKKDCRNGGQISFSNAPLRDAFTQ